MFTILIILTKFDVKIRNCTKLFDALHTPNFWFSLRSLNQSLVENQKIFHIPKLLGQVLISMTS